MLFLDNANDLSGNIQDIIYQGDSVLVIVQHDNLGMINVRVPANRAGQAGLPSKGERIGLALSSRRYNYSSGTSVMSVAETNDVTQALQNVTMLKSEERRESFNNSWTFGTRSSCNFNCRFFANFLAIIAFIL